jgi:hypothetical protein
MNSTAHAYPSCDRPRRPTFRPGKTHCFMGGAVLKGRECPVSLILYRHSIVIVNRDTIFSVAIRASYFIPAPTESQTRQPVIAPTRLCLLHTHRHIYETKRGRSRRCRSRCRACRRGREQANQRGTYRSGKGCGVLTQLQEYKTWCACQTAYFLPGG